MEHITCLGIYLSYNKVCGVALTGSGQGPELQKCFTITADPELDSYSRLDSLIGQSAKKISELDIKYNEITVSIDSAMYAQHSLQSDFSDNKQIQSTVAFDAEEAVATDANELAVTFNITGQNQLGSKLSVFTAKRSLMVHILEQFKSAGIDPISIEPDVVCLTRYINTKLAQNIDQSTLTIVIATGLCYMVTPGNNSFAPVVRSFLIYPNQDITGILNRQIPITIAANSPNLDNDITNIVITGKLDNININSLAQTTGLTVKPVEIENESKSDEDINITDFAVAYGTALSELTKIDIADFRKSYMPFQGKKRLLQNSIRMLAIYSTILLVALGVYFQAKVLRINSAVTQLKDKAKEQYSQVMFGRKPTSSLGLTTLLKKEADNIKSSGSRGLVGDENSVPAQFAYLLEALNTLPKSIKLELEDVKITPRGITIIGKTQNGNQSRDISKAIDNHPKLAKDKETFTSNTFNISAKLQ